MQTKGGSYEVDKKGKAKLIARTSDSDNGDKAEQKEVKDMANFQDSKTTQPQGRAS